MNRQGWAGTGPLRVVLALLLGAGIVGVPIVGTAAPASAATLAVDYVTVQTVQVPSGSSADPGFAEATAVCVPGDVALSGGVSEPENVVTVVSDGPLIANQALRHYAPSTTNDNLGQPADGWEAAAVNPFAGTQPLTAYAVCQPPTGGAVGPTTVVATPDAIMGGQEDLAFAACPSGMQATGGGADVDDPGPARLVVSRANTSGTSPTGWGTSVDNSGTSTLESFTGVICADQTGLGALVDRTTPGATDTCASGEEATGGGYGQVGPQPLLVKSIPLLAGGAVPTQGQGPVVAWTVAPAPPINSGVECVTTAAPATTTPAKPFTRLSGPDRIATAIAVSEAAFPTAGSAGGVVLARSDIFPDALGGTPLAADKDAPLLFTPPTSLDPRTAAEIARVISPGETVYLLGGTAALSAGIQSQLVGLGYATVRFAGVDRYDTAEQIASSPQGLGNPTTVFVATGQTFQAGLCGGNAAVAAGAAVLLSDDSVLPTTTATYLTAHPGDKVFALGDPAVAADPTATPVPGADPYSTCAAIATQFWPSPKTVGIASGVVFADALSGGVDAARRGGPLLLVDPSDVPAPISAYLAANKATIASLVVYGGSAAITDATATAAALDAS